MYKSFSNKIGSKNKKRMQKPSFQKSFQRMYDENRRAHALIFIIQLRIPPCHFMSKQHLFKNL